jgi:hypothetical protein
MTGRAFADRTVLAYDPCRAARFDVMISVHSHRPGR